MVKISIVGAGQIGSRHLQALAQIDREVSIQVVEPYSTAREIARERFNEVNTANKVLNVEYLDNITGLENDLDIAIVATNADVRRMVIEELLSQKAVKYIILEKVLFPQFEDFNVIDLLLKQNDVQAWVNCPRRMWPIYKEIKDKLKEAERIEYSVNGTRWDMGSNAIHFIDHFAYLTNQTKITLSADGLDPDTSSSKRTGCFEFTGNLYGSSAEGNRISLTSYNDHSAPLFVQIISDRVRCLVRESEGKAWISEKQLNWEWTEIPFTTPFQSQLTHLAVQQILDTGKSDLTPFNESWELHIPVLSAFIAQLNRTNGKEVIICPIS